MKKSKKLYVVLSAIILTMVLAACGGAGGAADTVAPPPAQGQQAQPPAAPTDTDADTGTDGGVVRFAAHWVISTSGYTPELTANSALPFVTLAHQSLLTFAADGSFAPLLATSWDVDADEPSITWNLRQGVLFSDGTPFNAAAVQRNIEEYQSFGRSEVANVSGFEIIDEHTIKMLLHQWDSSMLESIGFFVYYMSPTALEDIESLRTSSAGTGPFRVVDFQPGVLTVFERNEHYWEDGLPIVDRVEMHVVAEPTTRAAAFQAGEFDIVVINNLAVAQQLIDADEFILLENVSGAGLVGVGLIPNSRIEGIPFADPRVRQAMCYAIDEHAIANIAGFGLLQVTNQWAAPGAATFNPNVRGFPFNPDRARELLTEAGFPDGFETNIYTTTGHQVTVTAAAHMLQEVGIRANIIQIDEAAQTAFMANGEWDGIMMHFHAISPNLGLYMGRHLDGAFYVNGLLIPDEVMDMLQAIRTAPTEAERLRLEHEMQLLVYDELALFGQPIFVQREPVFTQPHLMDSNYGYYHLFTWTPAKMWINR